jgi:hypothetical protein
MGNRKVTSMAKQAADPKKAKSSGPPKGDDKAAKAKVKKAAAPEAAVEKAPEPIAEPVKVVPREPADPRLKVLKKFYGKFLPKGPLRDRHKVLMTRWNSGEDHGGVTVDELKSLLTDWRASRAKPVKKVKVG